MEKLNEYMKKIEVGLNNHMGKISLFLGFFIFFIYLLQYIQKPVWEWIILLFGITEITKTIELVDTIKIIGAIIVFWYGYKKYERDKELEIIDKYTDKYNLIKNELNKDLNYLNDNYIKLDKNEKNSTGKENEIKYGMKEIRNNIEKKFGNLLDLFYEEYYLFCKGYISEDLWKEWRKWIEIDIFLLIEIDAKYNLTKIEDKYNFMIVNIFNIYTFHNAGDNIKYKGKNFISFVFENIEKSKINMERYIKDNINKITESDSNFIKKELAFIDSVLSSSKERFNI